jgi:dihydrolipoamide dehydrogenase
METKYDICVIGGGPGGYVAAIRAAQNGARTVLIEKKHLGGTCLNVGCIPTKTLIAGTDLLHQARSAAAFGVRVTGTVSPDWSAMQRRKNDVIETLRKGIGHLLRSNAIDLLSGTASFLGPKRIQVMDEKGNRTVLEASKIIIATGSAPAMPGFLPASKRILSSTGLLEIGENPKRLLILGGGVIGCEFACLFAELGTQVTVVEMMSTILPSQDKEAARTLAASMKKSGIEVLTGHPLEKITATAKSVSGTVSGKTLSADYLLVSIGRTPVSSELNLQTAGVRTDERGWIPVDARCRTNVPGIFAIGDVTGTRWQLAHFASAMGTCAADNATGTGRDYEDRLVPGCIFTSPEIASIGWTEEECAAADRKVKIGKFPFAALGKAMAIQETGGFAKIIADAESDQILGVHIVGPHATDLISEAVTAMQLESTAEALGNAIHPHPTLGEALMEAAHAVHGKSAHIPPTRRK